MFSRVWDYFPHPVDHPGWFFATVFAIGTFAAGIAGDDDAAAAILGTGIMLCVFVRVTNGIVGAANSDGWSGVITRLWLILCVAWTCVFALIYGKEPARDEWVYLLAPWIGGPVLRKAIRFILGRGLD